MARLTLEQEFKQLKKQVEKAQVTANASEIIALENLKRNIQTSLKAPNEKLLSQLKEEYEAISKEKLSQVLRTQTDKAPKDFLESSMRTLLVALILSSFISCASKKEISREEYLKMTNRLYKDNSKDDLIRAGIEVMSLIDPSDTHLTHKEDGFIARRNWSLYMVLAASAGTDTWTFTVKDTPEGPKANIDVVSSSSAMGAMATSGGDLTATTYPGETIVTDGNVVYESFWKRMDFVLGKTNEWQSCKAISEDLKNGKLWGDDTKICSVTTEDLLPTNISEEAFKMAISKFNERDHYSITQKLNERRVKAGLKPFALEERKVPYFN